MVNFTIFFYFFALLSGQSIVIRIVLWSFESLCQNARVSFFSFKMPVFKAPAKITFFLKTV